MSFTQPIVTLALVFLSIFYYAQSAFAQDPNKNLEIQVKSAFIFKFGNYVTWPEKSFGEAASPIVIGIVDNELMAAELEKIASTHTVGSRPVLIKRINSKEMSAEVHILYMVNDATNYIANYRNLLNDPPTLYITDTVEGLSSGSIINFVQDENRIRFDISSVAAEHNKIKLDASLLTVARRVLMQ